MTEVPHPYNSELYIAVLIDFLNYYEILYNLKKKSIQILEQVILPHIRTIYPDKDEIYLMQDILFHALFHIFHGLKSKEIRKLILQNGRPKPRIVIPLRTAGGKWLVGWFIIWKLKKSCVLEAVSVI